MEQIGQKHRDIQFDNRRLTRLIWPLIVEQFLAIAVGIADSIMVASVGEAAVSAVSLVDTVNVLLIYAFNALATGGAVVAGQYLGRDEKDSACVAAQQLMVFMLVLSSILSGCLYVSQSWVLGHLFGHIEADVMGYCRTYFSIVEGSIPFVALYSAGAALFRVMGDSATSMRVSLWMNGINVLGNAVLIYGFHRGVEGVAIPTLVSRVVAAAMVVGLLLRRQNMPVHLPWPIRFRYDRAMVGRIVRLGVPNGIENSLFQLGKILLLSVASAFGTAGIAANAICNTLAGFEITASQAVGLALVTVVSHCVGAGAYDMARYYTRKLLKLSYGVMLLSNGVLLAVLPLLIRLYGVSPEASELARTILWMHSAFAILLWPAAFTLPQTLKAAGDTRFTMVVATLSMWIFRIAFGVWFAKGLQLGVLGIWMAMMFDWMARIVFFAVRYRSHRWETKAI